MDDLSVQGMKVKDESAYERDGTVSRARVYQFYLGKHGPFTERVPLADFDAGELDRRITTLRAHLSALPR